MEVGLLLLRGAHVFAPEDRGCCDVLVAGGRIAAVAPALASPPVDWPVEVVDCAGKWLIPGLVDAHVHLAGGGGEGGAETRVPAVQLGQLAGAGVTTAIGLLGTDGTTRTIAELLASARALDALGLTTLCYTGSYEVPPVTLTGSVRGDLVHVDRIVAVGEVAISDHRSSQPTFEELLRIASDAHVAGMMAKKAGLVHLHLGDGPRGLAHVWRALAETELPARVWHPTHVNRNPRLWAESQAIARKGVTVDVTAFPDDDDDPALPADAAIAAYLQGGGPADRITLSSDGGGCLPTFAPGGELLRMDVGTAATLLPTVARLIARGIPVSAALAPCTATPAALFRLPGKGRIAAGSDADLALVTPNLEVEAVLARGRWLVRGGAPVARGPFER